MRNRIEFFFFLLFTNDYYFGYNIILCTDFYTRKKQKKCVELKT